MVSGAYDRYNVTLIMTLIRPEGIWQSADYRTTLAGKIYNDATPKQLHVILSPSTRRPSRPNGLQRACGDRRWHANGPLDQELFRGESRFIMPSLEHLAERLTRDVSSSRYGGEMLLIAGGIFEGDRRFSFSIPTRSGTTHHRIGPGYTGSSPTTSPNTLTRYSLHLVAGASM